MLSSTNNVSTTRNTSNCSTTSNIEIRLKPSSQTIGNIIQANLLDQNKLSETSKTNTLRDTIRDEYAYRYLENIKVFPSKKLMNKVHKELPISEAFMYTDIVKNSVVIVPGMAKHSSNLLKNDNE